MTSKISNDLNQLKLTLKDILAIISVVIALTTNFFALKFSVDNALNRIEVVNAEQNLIRSNDRELINLRIEALRLELQRQSEEIKELKTKNAK